MRAGRPGVSSHRPIDIAVNGARRPTCTAQHQHRHRTLSAAKRNKNSANVKSSVKRTCNIRYAAQTISAATNYRRHQSTAVDNLLSVVVLLRFQMLCVVGRFAFDAIHVMLNLCQIYVMSLPPCRPYISQNVRPKR